ncbi:MAG: 16S rRNA (adenine(1518)-N(6)/adenine(1519)-N(6))-dimethyltransferase RsmA [Nitrospira sp.]|nr:ribosomal RNA small subunit methyltransferase A [Candidatus Manganitrophaceae bacterium]HIL34424.1 ribosomal RNA small subunit methyltransferase A [Candidatus Manganitrophaceae bacterium]
MKTAPNTFTRPRKSWGQNFLIDFNIQRKILDLAEIKQGEKVIEIGPGRGMLTRGLLERRALVTAIEIDPHLVERLKREMPSVETPNFDLVLGDALRYPYEAIQGTYKVVANLPYNLSTPILFRLLEEHRQIRMMILMLQREVADRLAAQVGTKSYGALTVTVQYCADVRAAFDVPPGCFRPRPRVHSTVILLTPRSEGRMPVQDETLFLKVVKGAFAYRRKRVVNSLVESGFSKEIVLCSLEKIGLDPGRRGETFTLSEFVAMAKEISRLI